MSMKLKEDIVVLIKSLSKSEKRYFKLFVSNSSIGEGNHYIKLFDLIDNTGSAEKKVIQKLYGNDAFMKNGFSVYKGFLYKQILKSLKAYHSEKSIDDKILELIRDSIVLFNKNLFSNAAKILEKAKTIALKYEKHTLLLEIVRWQKKIINAWSIYEDPNEKEVIMVFEEEKLMINKIDNASNHWKQNALMYISYRISGVARTEEDIRRYSAIIDVPFLKNQELALSFHAKRDFYITWQYYFGAVNNLEETLKYGKNVVALMETYPHQIEDNPVHYNQALHNLLFTLQCMEKYKEFFILLPKLKSMLSKFQLPLSDLIRSYNTEFVTYIATGQYKKASLLLPKIETLIKEKKNDNELYDLFFIASKAELHFGNGDYHKALANINIILNNKKNYLSQDHYNFCRIFQLIIHFEKENAELMPYLLKSFYRHLMKKNQLYKVEKIFLKFIATSLENKTVKDQIEDFKLLRDELLNISEDPMEAIFLANFDVISWLQSRIEKRPFGEVLREKWGYPLKEEK